MSEKTVPFRVGYAIAESKEKPGTELIFGQYSDEELAEYYEGRAAYARDYAAKVQAAVDAKLADNAVRRQAVAAPLKTKTFRWLDWVFLLIFAAIIAAVAFFGYALVAITRDHDAKLNILANVVKLILEDRGDNVCDVPKIIPQFRPAPPAGLGLPDVGAPVPLHKLM